jgi:hypothetical protein
MRKALAHTGAYDTAISATLATIDLSGERFERRVVPLGDLAPRMDLSLEKVRDLRYGENPHQKGAWYRPTGSSASSGFSGTAAYGLGAASILQGKELSYTNLLDLDAALRIVLEFDDHLVLFEVPLSEARSKPVIDEARKLSTKPLTHAVVSHHHFDHSGGLRVAVAEGLTIITQRGNEAFFKDLVARPWTVQPDALAKAPKPLNLQLVDDTLTLKDASMELQLYHLLDNPREGTNLFGYVPRDRILIQADLYDNTWERHLWGQNVLDNIARRKLRVDRDVPVHGAMEPFAAMVQNIKTKTGS